MVVLALVWEKYASMTAGKGEFRQVMADLLTVVVTSL